MSHEYGVTLTRRNGPQAGESLSFDVTNHDDLFVIVDRIKAKGLVDESESAELAIALKLFGEVLLRHRKAEPFASLAPHFGEFMKKIKGRG